MCAFVPDTPEHRTIFVGTSTTLPEHNIDQIPHRGSTVSMARMCTVAIIIALAALVGLAFSPKAPCHRPCVHEAATTRSGTPVHYGRAPGLTRLEPSSDNTTEVNSAAGMLTTPKPEGSGGLQRTRNRAGCYRSSVEACPTDAKEREKDRRKKQKEAGKEHKVIKKKKIV